MLAVDRRLREVAAWVQDTTPQLVELMLARMRTEVPAYFDSDDPAFMDTARESIVANLEAVADALQSGRERPRQLPPGAVEEALIAARQRMPWTLIDRTYRIGHAVLWEQLLVEVESWRLDSSERLDLLRVISHFFFQYVDHVAGGLADVHQAERDRQIRGRERRRIAWVREVLADVAGSDSGGDYDLARQHLAAVAWGTDGERRDRRPRTATAGGGARRPGPERRCVGVAGRALHRCRRGRSSHAARPPRRDVSRARCARRRAPRASGSAIARRSRPRVCSAAPARRWASTTTSHSRRSCCATSAPHRTSSHASSARCSTAASARRSCSRRWLVYVSSGWSAASTGARLGVHERTIGYRVATIEQRLGRPLAARRDELGVALRLHAALRR